MTISKTQQKLNAISKEETGHIKKFKTITQGGCEFGGLSADEQTDDKLHLALCEEPLLICLMKSPTEAQLKKAIDLYPMVFLHLKKEHQTDNLLVHSVSLKKSYYATSILASHKPKTEKACLDMVRNNPELFKYCGVQTDEICLIALEMQDNSLFVKNTSENLYLQVLSKNNLFFKMRNFDDIMPKNPSREFLLVCANINGMMLGALKDKDITEEICLASVKNNWLSLFYVPKKLLTEEICLAAYEQNVKSLQFLWPEVLLDPVEFAVKFNGHDYLKLKTDNSSEDSQKLRAFWQAREMEVSIRNNALEFKGGDSVNLGVQVIRKPMRIL